MALLPKHGPTASFPKVWRVKGLGWGAETPLDCLTIIAFVVLTTFFILRDLCFSYTKRLQYFRLRKHSPRDWRKLEITLEARLVLNYGFHSAQVSNA